MSRARQSQASPSRVCEEFLEGGVELDNAMTHSEPEPSDLDDEDRGKDITPELIASFARREGTIHSLFLDYDGTLREFETKPEHAVPTAEIIELLDELNKRSVLPGENPEMGNGRDLHVSIISGRDANFLERHFGRYDFTLVAEHGYQIKRGQTEPWSVLENTADMSWKSTIMPILEQFVLKTPGTHLENKLSSLVWHYRGAEDEALAVRTSLALAKHLKTTCGHLPVEVSRGNKIVEVASVHVKKGPVMLRLLGEFLQAANAVGLQCGAVLCAGDDVSDESMFICGRGLHPLVPLPPTSQPVASVKVGVAHTSAAFRVQDPRALRALLGAIKDAQPMSDDDSVSGKGGDLEVDVNGILQTNGVTANGVGSPFKVGGP